MMKTIYRYYSDVEVVSIGIKVRCPYCGHTFLSYNSNDCGETYIKECEECEIKFKMYFDVD